MQKSYLVKQSVDFGQIAKFLIRPGDILVFDSANHNKVTVYRNGEIMKVLANQSLSGLQGLAKSGWIAEIHPNEGPRHAIQPSRTTPAVAGKPSGSVSSVGSGKIATSVVATPQKASKRGAVVVASSLV